MGSFRQPGSQFHIPIEGTSILIRTRSKLLGLKQIHYGMKVNTISMYGPSTGSNGSDPIIEYDENKILIPGQWGWIKVYPHGPLEYHWPFGQ